MSSPLSRLWVERLAWIFLYGGLLLLVLGVFVTREAIVTGRALEIAGSLAAAAGVALIWIRSRMNQGDTQ